MTAVADLLTFERFVPGAEIGRFTERIGAEVLARWRALYPWDAPAGDRLPNGLATVLLMRGYMNTLSPRPPGNVHARQTLALHSAPRVGEAVTTTYRCAGKEMRRERRYVEVDAQARGEDGRLLFDGRMTLIWAA